MKMSPLIIALVAVVSSLATVAALELFRTPAPASVSDPAAEPVREVRAAADPQVRPAAQLQAPAKLERSPSIPEASDLTERIAALELRLAQLEAGTPRRTPASDPTPAPEEQEALRGLVFDWIAEERETHKQDRVAADEQAKRSAMEFKARYQALEFAREHDLEDWQQERWAELFLLMREREREILADVDIERDDPAEVEARWEEYDEWVDRLERELTLEITPELYEEIYGED